MKKIGIDFGTTNSTLSYVNPENNALECYKMGRAGGAEYIPSFISYEKEGNAVGIGDAARLRQADDDYMVFSRFKMLLNETDEDRLRREGYESKTPVECARDYLKTLLETYRKENNLDDLEHLVITVPEIWIKENDHTSRKTLAGICEELSLPLKRLLSEPTAATAYFSDCYKKKNGGWYDGHVLVCDYGGGTLDLSLSHIQSGQITVLESTGKGHDDRMIGKAGAAFDAATVRRVFERESGEKISSIDLKFLKLLGEFEKGKITLQDEVGEKLKQYLRYREIDKKLFNIDGFSVQSSDMVHTFQELIRADFEAALADMKSAMEQLGVDYEHREKFRVVMAGGFSGFYLVREAAREILGAGKPGSDDPRFKRVFTLQDVALSIAKGAALVANDIVRIERACPVSVGLRLQVDPGDGIHGPQDVPILAKGTQISDYHKPVFLPGGVEINMDLAALNNDIVIFLGDGKHRRHHRLDKNVSQLLPNIEDRDNRWQVGFSVDENLLFTFHAKDRRGNVKDTALGDILRAFSGPIYRKEG